MHRKDFRRSGAVAEVRDPVWVLETPRAMRNCQAGDDRDDEDAQWRMLGPAIGLPVALFLTIIRAVRTLELTMSTEATLTSKGQTTIPKSIRDSLGMKAGDRMSFTLMPDGVVVMRVKNKRVSELAGLLYKKGRKPLRVELLSR